MHLKILSHHHHRLISLLVARMSIPCHSFMQLGPNYFANKAMHRFISIPLPIPKVPSLFVAVFVIPNELAILALHVCQSQY